MNSATHPVAVILSKGETPSTDYFLTPYLESMGYEVTILSNNADTIKLARNINNCHLIVISRYLNGKWREQLNHLHRDGTKLVYFMDDDLFDIRALPSLPFRYQWKIITQAFAHRNKILAMCDEFWVSTEHLAEKYAQHNPVMLSPRPSSKTFDLDTGIRVCYHGTASHQQEISWLSTVIESVQSQSKNIHFEMFGSQSTNKLIRSQPRISVLHPMSWPNYLEFTASRSIDIALAPLLPGTFNAARAPTKFFDYARMGAVGLYSNVSPYREFIRNGIDGLLLGNDPTIWAQEILALSRNDEKRKVMGMAVKQRVVDGIKSDPR